MMLNVTIFERKSLNDVVVEVLLPTFDPDVSRQTRIHESAKSM